MSPTELGGAMSNANTQIAKQPTEAGLGYADAVAEETRSHNDIITPCELEVAPVFTVEELDFSDYRWGRGDYRSQRDMDMYEAGHSARDFR